MPNLHGFHAISGRTPCRNAQFVRFQPPQFPEGAGLVGAAAAVTPPVTANAIPTAPQERLKAAVPGPLQVAAETMPPASDPVNQTSSGGDFMTDVLNSLGIEYLAINCGSSYRGLHEAVINHANTPPAMYANLACVYKRLKGRRPKDGHEPKRL